MALPTSGTFDYVTVMPTPASDGVVRCRARTRTPVAHTGNNLVDARLVGLSPSIEIADAGLTPDPSPERPRVMRSSIAFTASPDDRAQVRFARFHVVRSVMGALRAGDMMHFARSHSADLAMSVLRDGRLIVAIGAVCAVPLGHDIEARYPRKLIEQATDVFRQCDPDFRFAETPLEIVADRSRRPSVAARSGSQRKHHTPSGGARSRDSGMKALAMTGRLVGQEHADYARGLNLIASDGRLVVSPPPRRTSRRLTVALDVTDSAPLLGIARRDV